ncbi:MAG: MFS transporter [Thermaerobacter sp.]|nr:MFS transporter [Thermaerobacter sp.]
MKVAQTSRIAGSNWGVIFSGITLVFSLSGISGIMIVNLLTFLFAAFLENGMMIEKGIENYKKPKKTVKSSLSGSYSYLKSDVYILYIIILICVLNFFTGAIHILLPSFIQNNISHSEIAYSATLSSMAIGSLAGSILFSGLLNNDNRVLTMSLIIYGVAMISTGLVNSIIVICVLFAIIGVATTVFNVIVISLLQTFIPKEMRGQLFTIVIGVSKGLLPVSYGFFGIVGDIFKNAYIFIIVGSALVIGGIFMQLIARKRRDAVIE